jgi:4-alpha-glucanotransferase
VKRSLDTSSELLELARLCGIQPSYTADDEARRDAEPEVLAALIRELGVPIDRASDVAPAVRERQLLAARRVIEPVVVLRSGRPATISVTLPDHFDASSAWATTRFEDGSQRRERLLGGAAPVATLELGGQRFYRYLVSFPATDRPPTPFGYHTLTVEVSGAGHVTETASALVISAPPCPRAARGWGVFMPLYALRTNSDWGVGSYRDLAHLGEWVSHQGAAMVGGLPLYPTYLDPPIDPSPYRPVSRLAYNELYIDPTALPELAASREALSLMESKSFLARVARARTAKLVDYEVVTRLRRQVLEPLADTFFAASSSRRSSFEMFLREHPELLAYAQFRAAVDRLGRGFVLALEEVPEIPGENAPSLNYHLYCQWAAYEQLRVASDAIPLYADLPVGVHPEGFDPFWSPESFVVGAKGGSPPDVFFSEGQDWSFPPLHPDTIRDDGYRYLRAVLTRALSHTSYLRVDHVMGLHRLYVIPQGFDAQHGAYVSYQADEMRAVVSLEAHRAGSAVVGEDLGTVPDAVREHMREDRMLRTWVFEFKSTLEDPLPQPQTDVLASLATHDTPRFSSFLWGTDIDETEKLGHLSAEDADAQRAERALYREALFRAMEIPVLAPAELTNAARRGCEAHIAASEARLVLIDLEELWGESEPQNRPGTVHGNWRQRGALTLEEAEHDADLNVALKEINDLRKLFES